MSCVLHTSTAVWYVSNCQKNLMLRNIYLDFFSQRKNTYQIAVQVHMLIFLLLFAEFVKSTAFYTLLLLFQRFDMFELLFDAKITIQTRQPFGIAAT